MDIVVGRHLEVVIIALIGYLQVNLLPDEHLLQVGHRRIGIIPGGRQRYLHLSLNMSGLVNLTDKVNTAEAQVESLGIMNNLGH